MAYRDATVTIQRRLSGGDVIDITVAFGKRGPRWFIKDILDEDGNQVVLTKREEEAARKMVEAGWDETGR